MKITKTQLRSWIKECLVEMKEGEEAEEEPSQVDATDIEDNPFEKEEVKESLVKEGTKRIFVKEIQKWPSNRDNLRLFMKEGRLEAFKECIIGHSEENTVSIKDVNKEIAKELKGGQK